MISALLMAALFHAPVQFLHCSDGDSCRIKYAGTLWMNVRLAGIDAPERSQPFANEARSLLESLVIGKPVTIRQIDLDHYNRPVVEVTAGDGSVINRRLIQAGYAEAYRGKVKRLDMVPYFTDEALARQKRQGIWSLKDYQTPAAYRRANR